MRAVRVAGDGRGRHDGSEIRDRGFARPPTLCRRRAESMQHPVPRLRGLDVIVTELDAQQFVLRAVLLMQGEVRSGGVRVRHREPACPRNRGGALSADRERAGRGGAGHVGVEAA